MGGGCRARIRALDRRRPARALDLKFAVDATELDPQLYPQAEKEAATDTLGWLVSAGYSYQALRDENARRVTRMSRLSAGLALLLIAQTISWLVPLGWTDPMAPKPVPPDQIKPLPTTIGIEEGRGGAKPRPS
jgi:hypothetical protein